MVVILHGQRAFPEKVAPNGGPSRSASGEYGSQMNQWVFPLGGGRGKKWPPGTRKRFRRGEQARSGAVDAEDRKREHLALRVSFLMVMRTRWTNESRCSLVGQAEDRDRARAALMANYGWDKFRADAVLQLRLERLTQAERKLVHDELRQLREQLRAGSVTGPSLALPEQ